MAEHERPNVAYLGPEASYTHQAALDAFNAKDVTFSPQTTIADVFTAVQNGTAYRGVVPFENSSNGSVVFTLDLIANLHGMHPDILVCGEAYVSVKHCLLGHTSPISGSPNIKRDVKIDKTFTNPLVEPRSDLSKIKKLYSHPQAWGQCKAFLATYLKGVHREDVDSTSRAAQIVAADTTGQSAALSSLAAAKVFNLDVLAENINDRTGNTTRFLVIQRSSATSSTPPPLSPTAEEKWKSLVTFTLDHTRPGSLAQCLSAFSNEGISLTLIHTRPSGVENWHYVFFVEFGGRKEAGDVDGSVNRALRELDGVARGWRWLGSWRSEM